MIKIESTGLKLWRLHSSLHLDHGTAVNNVAESLQSDEAYVTQLMNTVQGC